jgi:hypothetical protein
LNNVGTLLIKFIQIELVKARNILVRNGKEIDDLFFSDFPRGCCGNASDILGQWLSSKGITGLETVSGWRKETSHAWLEYEGLILDITSDQFSDGCGEVFVGKYSKFHSSFKSQERSPLDISAILSSAYKKFSDLMERA